MSRLQIQGLVKRFGDVTALQGFDLDVADGEFVSLLGPSGCGKSTTLAALAGLDRPDEGRITLGDRVFFDAARDLYLEPEDRDCGLVFQSYALWPHMTVRQNVAFPLDIRKIPKARQHDMIDEALALVEMQSFADRYPFQLSGGQQQRVALARTLVYKPELLLLDEPLSNLDAKLRDRARVWLAELSSKLRLTTIYVTHDQIEALALSDRIVVMNGGKIVQIGTPEEIYENPADPFVADFIGTSSFLDAQLDAAPDGSGHSTVRLGDGQSLRIRSTRALKPSQKVTLALRPAQLRFASEAEAGANTITADMVTQSYVGARWQVTLDKGGARIRIDADQRQPDGKARIFVPEDAALVFPARG